MSVQDKATLKSYFETGDKPTQTNFEDLIDSLLDQSDGFKNGGNSYGANAAIGTNDAYDLTIKAHNADKIIIGSSTVNVNSTFKVLDPSENTRYMQISHFLPAANYPRTLIQGGQSSGDTNWSLRLAHAYSSSASPKPVSIQLSTTNDAGYVSTNNIVLYASTGFHALMSTTGTSGNGLGIAIGTNINIPVSSNNAAIYIDTVTNGQVVKVQSTTTSTSTTTGALQVAGGVGVQGTMNVGSTAVFSASIRAATNIQFFDSSYKTGLSTSSNTLIVGTGFTNTDVYANNSSMGYAVSRFNSIVTPDAYLLFKNANTSGAGADTRGIITLDGAASNVGLSISTKGRVAATGMIFTSNVNSGVNAFQFANALNTPGDHSLAFYNQTTGNTSNRVVFRLINHSSTNAASGNTYLWAQATTITNGSEKTAFGIDTLTAGGGTRSTRFKIDGSEVIIPSGNTLSVASDTDTTTTLGRVKLGTVSGQTDVAYFGHFDNYTATNYAIAQNSGRTFLNTPSGNTMSFRVNNTELMTLGSDVFSFMLPMKLKSYTVATVPSASTAGAGSVIYVSDETGGATLAFSDGTDWRRAHDRVVIS